MARGIIVLLNNILLMNYPRLPKITQSSLLLFLVVAMLFGCSKDSYDLITEDDLKELNAQTSHYEIDMADAVDIANDFLKSAFPEKPKTKSGNIETSVRTIYRTIDILPNTGISTKSFNVTQEQIPLYVVSYTENNQPSGFVVTVGDERVRNKVLVFNDNGDWDISGLPAFEEIFYERADAHIANEIANYAPADPADPCESDLEQTDITTDKTTQPNVIWGYTSSPYNDFREVCPEHKLKHESNFVTATIATLMAYYQHPLSGSYTSIQDNSTIINTTYNWGLMKSQSSAQNLSTTAKTMVSNLYGEITSKLFPGIKHVCYVPVFSRNVESSIKECFSNMGYRNTITTTSNLNDIKQEINNGYPVFVCGASIVDHVPDSYGNDITSSWLIEKYKDINTTVRNIRYCPGSDPEVTWTNYYEYKYLYMNLCNNGVGNGYYSYTDNWFDAAPNGYKYGVKGFKNIRPN